METSAECICCNEIPNVLTKKQENNSSIKCITEHPGFSGCVSQCMGPASSLFSVLAGTRGWIFAAILARVCGISVLFYM